MHSLHLLILISVLPTHFTLAFVSEDNNPSITSPNVIPLDFQPDLRRREGAEIPWSLRRSTSDTCPSNYQQCGNGLPKDFCCNSSDSCISLANNTSALCCPDGSGTCSSILPITCSLAVQNATAYPTSSVHTLNLDGQLPACGTDSSGTQTCCPFGYACNDESFCVATEGTETETPVSTGILSMAMTSPSSSSMTMTITSSSGGATVLITAEASSAVAIPTSVPDSDQHSPSDSSSQSRSIGIATGSAVAGVAAVAGVLVFAWVKRRRIKEKLRVKRQSNTQRLSSEPPPLPPKEYHQVARKKRKSMLSWVPSVVNRTPAELPATPVSFSAWNSQSGGMQPPNRAHRPYPRDSLSIPECYELEARWLPQEVR